VLWDLPEHADEAAEIVFDRYWTIPELSLDSHAVEEVLSI
jgi:hypothetical protein